MRPRRGQTRLLTLGLRLIPCLLLPALVSVPASAADADPRLAAIASEARQTIEVINWFYLRHRACPQPSRAVELEAMQRELGDGFSVDLQGQFVAIRGISMSSVWLYYTSTTHPEKCTLWRKLGWDPALIWRRHNGGRWTYDPGDGTAERPLKLAPLRSGMGDKQ